MGLRTTLPAIAAVLATAVAGWLYVDNRRLAGQVADLRRADKVAAADPWARPRVDGPTTERAADRPAGGMFGWRRPRPVATDAPATPPSPPSAEARLERRVERTRFLEDLLGRRPGETDDEYRARLLPMMQLALGPPRERVDEMRKAAEAAARVSDDQRRQLDDAFGSVYDELIEFTDGAVAEGALTPYGRNVQGVLQYAGGLGSILEGAEGRIGKILSPEQLQTMSDAGFEWGEYLGLHAPWERLRPPPPRPTL